MIYEDRIVCFLDILGFKNIINDAASNKKVESQYEISDIINILDIMKKYLKIESNESREVTQFSDCIVISFLENDRSGVFYILLDLLHLIMELLSNKIIVRGAITKGKLLHNKDLVFGPALVKAYELESTVAIYPRIILGNEILLSGAMNHNYDSSSTEELESIWDIISKDADGMFYIDYFNSAQSELNHPEDQMPKYLTNLKEFIETSIESSNYSIKIKYMWMANKFNELINNPNKEQYFLYLEKKGKIELATEYRKIKIINY